MLTVRSTINFASQTVPPIIPVVQGDPGRAILFTLADFTIPAGATATYYVQKPSGEAVYNNATIDGNNVLVNLTAQSIIEKGDNYGQVRIAVGGDVVTSFDFILLVKEFRGIEAVQSLTEMNIFDKAVEQAADAIDEVKTDALDDIGDAKDAALQEIEQTTGNFADDFSASATYAAGDYVMHSGQLYRFTANHAAGAWTGSDAEAVTVGEELTDLKAETTDLKEDLNDTLQYNGIGNSFDGSFYNGYWSSSGVLTSAQNDVCCATKIPCPANANVVLITKTNVTGYAIYISYFDESGTTRLRRDVANSAKYEGVSPAGTYWFAFTYERSGITKDNFGTAEVYINNVISDIKNNIELLDNKIDAVKSGDINNGSISIKKTDFLEVETGNNLHDPSTDVTGSWFTTANGNVILQSNQYTGNYTAILVLLPDVLPEYITVSANEQYAYLYSYYMIGAESVPASPLSSGQPKQYVQNGYAIDVPAGAKAVCLSMQNISDITVVMVNEGNTKLPIEPYTQKYLLNGNQIAFEDESKEVLKLPNSFHAVVGDTFELFYKGISNVVDSDKLEFDITANAGKAFEKRYIVTPTVAGTESIAVSVKNNDGKETGNGAFNLVTVAVPSSPGTQKNVLCIGDSLTQDGVWCAETDRRLTGSGGSPAGNGLSNISFIGTKHNGTTGYEGYGGWTINSYLSSMTSDSYMIISGTFDKTVDDQHSIYKDANNKQWKLETIGANQITIIRVSDSGVLPSSGTLTWVSGGVNTGNIVYTSSEQAPGNPFWNVSTGQIDFASYASNLNISSIDYAVILLGWNSTGASETNYKEKFTQFITALQTAFPTCKVVLLGLQVPSRNGLANNYGTSWKYYNTLQNVWKINKWYSELADTLNNVSYVNIAGQFDSEHSYPIMTMAVNTRSAETEEIQSNGVHPNTSGKYQIADAVYRELCALLQ